MKGQKHSLRRKWRKMGRIGQRYLLQQRVNSWRMGQWPEYMDTMTHPQASTLLKAITRMLEIENNFRNMYPNNMYHMCQQEDETQVHILEKCQALHPNATLITSKEELFSQDFD